ncbi:MAG: GtrA family protein [Clostridia bacterium]|nr:GtrA family protein [Clostridia bacterium]
MLKKLMKLIKSETGLYLLFGVLTTLVNYVVFVSFSFILGHEMVLITNTIAFIVSVVFAYITNKLYVFKSKSWEYKILLKEISAFILARVFSYFFEQIGLYICADILHLEKYAMLGIDGIIISKAILNIFVIILNWVFSKFIIFKKEK